MCSFPRFFVFLKSYRTTWTCAVPKAVPVVLQHCNTELEKHCPRNTRRCRLRWSACSPASALRRRGRLLLPLSNTKAPESLTPCVVLKEDHLSWSAVGCVPQLLRAPEGWAPRRGRKGYRVGHSQVPARLLWGGGTFPNASTLGSFWE